MANDLIKNEGLKKLLFFSTKMKATNILIIKLKHFYGKYVFDNNQNLETS
jgi:Holliday junction resolvase